MFLKARHVLGIHDESTACRDDRAVTQGQFLHDALFQFAKPRLALLIKDLRNGFSSAGLNHCVRIEKGKVQLFGYKSSDGRFAGAHETAQRDVANGTGHGHDVRMFRVGNGCTQKFCPWRRICRIAEAVYHLPQEGK